MTIGILPPSFHLRSEKRDANSAKKGGDKNAVALLKDVRQLNCVFQDRTVGIFIDFTEG